MSVVGNNKLVVTFQSVNSPRVKSYILYGSLNGGPFLARDTLPEKNQAVMIDTVPNLNLGLGQWCFKVLAQDTCSPALNPIAATFCPMHIVTTPLNLSARITWPKFIGWNVGSYQVQRYNPATNAWVQRANLASTARTYLDTPLACNSTVYYRVQATEVTGGASRTSLSDTQAVRPYDTIPPALPLIKFLTVNPGGILQINWFASTSNDVGKYLLYRQDSAGNYVLKLLAPSNQISYYRLTDLDSTKNDCYKISARDTCGLNEFPLSMAVSVCAIKPIAQRVGCAKAITVAWNGYTGWPGGVAKYLLYRSIDNGPYARFDSTRRRHPTGGYERAVRAFLLLPHHGLPSRWAIQERFVCGLHRFPCFAHR